jgi:DNA-binding transcriptional ArsR family regulator
MLRAEAHADVFRTIADPTRRAILDRLRAGPAPVNALAEDFEQTRPGVSKHLRVLRVTLRHEGFGARAEACGSHARGWERVLTWLESYLEKPELPGL